MVTKRNTKTIAEVEATRPSWTVEFRRSALVCVAFILLSAVGQWGLAPVKFLTDVFPQGSAFSLDSVIAAASFGVHSPPTNIALTIIDMDEALHKAWGRPCITPRSKLVELIEAAALKKPKAIVVDVSLECANDSQCCPSEADPFGAYLTQYNHDVPLILIRGLFLESHPTGQQVRLNASPYDQAVRKNGQHISWAHTFYLTDGDGTVRRWQQSWEACNDSGATETVPSVPVRIAALLDSAPAQPAVRNRCDLSSQTAPRHLVVLGARLLGESEVDADAGAPRVLPGQLLLDSADKLDAKGYFSLTDRIAIIGASHSRADDSWRTAVGYIPGVELVAQTVRFSQLQMSKAGGFSAYMRPLLQVVVPFVLLAAIFFFFRPFIAAILAVAAVIVIALVCASYLGWLDIFESLERTIWYFAGYQLVVGLLKFAKDTQRYPRRRKARAVLAERIRREDPECRSGF